MRSLRNSRLGGGESGIRTHGTFQYTRFPSVRLKPLGHLSAETASTTRYSPVVTRISRIAAPRPSVFRVLSIGLPGSTVDRGFGMAEREGFEPSIGFHLYTLSRGALSAAQPPLRARETITYRGRLGGRSALDLSGIRRAAQARLQPNRATEAPYGWRRGRDSNPRGT